MVGINFMTPTCADGPVTITAWVLHHLELCRSLHLCMALQLAQVSKCSSTRPPGSLCGMLEDQTDRYGTCGTVAATTGGSCCSWRIGPKRSWFYQCGLASAVVEVVGIFIIDIHAYYHIECNECLYINCLYIKTVHLTYVYILSLSLVYCELMLILNSIYEHDFIYDLCM